MVDRQKIEWEWFWRYLKVLGTSLWSQLFKIKPSNAFITVFRKEIDASTGFLVGVKTNSVEFQEKGLSMEDAKLMCRMMEVGVCLQSQSGAKFQRW